MAQRRRKKRKIKSGVITVGLSLLCALGVIILSAYFLMNNSVFLEEVTLQGGGEINLADLLNEDSKDTDLSLIKVVSGDIDLTKLGTREIEVSYKDKSPEKITITVVDTEGPVFEGLGDLDVSKSYLLDYKKGISANDKLEGAVEFAVDSSAVNIDKAGTYFATYTATDSKGNTTTMKRKVVIANDSSDTDNLVLAAIKDINARYGTSPTPIQIKNFIVARIRYNSSWGEPDPVYYGFKNNIGNCFVHALCFETLLEYYGYEYQRIWVTQKDTTGKPTHYWTLVKVNGEWKHMDATPGVYHQRYSGYMNDAQRYETLVSQGKNRDWDRSQWPSCK